MPTEVTDPALLAQLEGSGSSEVTDPALLAQLEGTASPMAAPTGQNKALGPWASAVVRPLAKGVAALPLMAMDAGVAARNLTEQGVRKFAPGIAEKIDSVTGGGPGQPYELPSEMFNRSLDAYTTTPEGVGKGAEFVSSALVGGGVPAPQAAVQAPRALAGAVNAAERYVVPPSQREGAGALTRALEGVAGKTSVAQRASMKNQPVTNELASRAIGLDEVPDTGEGWRIALNTVRERAGRVYQEVADSGEILSDQQYGQELADMLQQSRTILQDFPDAAPAASREIGDLVQSLWRDKFNARSALEYLKELRSQASGNLSWKSAEDPAKRALGMAQREAAGILEEMIVRHLGSQGRGALAESFNSARQQIARTYVVQGALNESTGNIIASAVGNQAKKGKVLTGELGQIANFARAYPKAAKEVTESFPGISPWDAGFTMAAGLTTGSPLVALYPVARIGLREALTAQQAIPGATREGSDITQRALASALAQMETQ